MTRLVDALGGPMIHQPAIYCWPYDSPTYGALVRNWAFTFFSIAERSAYSLSNKPT